MTNSVVIKYRASTEAVSDVDCVLVVGPDKLKVPANSLFLSATSRPFRAIFSPEWRQGHDLSATSDIISIPLPDDDATTIQLLCAVLHHQNDSIPRELPARNVLDIAIAADKYDCIQAFRFASESWLQTTHRTPNDLIHLIAAAYLLNHTTAFRSLTSALIFNHTGSFMLLATAEVEAILNWQVLVLLEESRSTARSELAHILLNGIDDPRGTCVHRCGWSSKHAYAYLHALQTQRLWPTALETQSLAGAIARADFMADPVPTEASAECQFDYKHTAPAYKNGRKWGVEDLQKRVGICLRCVKAEEWEGARGCSGVH